MSQDHDQDPSGVTPFVVLLLVGVLASGGVAMGWLLLTPPPVAPPVVAAPVTATPGVVPPASPAHFNFSQVKEAARLVKERLGKSELELVGFLIPKKKTTKAYGDVTAIRVTLRGDGPDKTYWALLRDGVLVYHFPDPPESDSDTALKAEVEAPDV